MNQGFDYFNRYQIPTFTLCNPDKTQLYILGDIYDRKLTLKYNAISELSFTAKSGTAYYDLLNYRRLIHIEEFGYFMITGIENESDGIQDIKKITAQSIDVELYYRKLSNFKGTYKFYDYFNPSTTLIGTLLAYLPNWSVGVIDGSLIPLYRTFNETDTTIYAFLINKVEQAYKCVFVFDYENYTISAYSPSTATKNTDIILSHKNLIEDIKIKTSTDQLVTALNVFGKGDLDIRTVNPLGTATLYDFTFYKNAEWMSGSLISKITAWEQLVDTYQPTYATKLTELKNLYEELTILNSEYADLKADYNSLDGVRKARIEQGNSDLSGITAQCEAKQAEMDSKQGQIDNKNTQITAKKAELVAINDLLKFENNFTASELIELNNFIIVSTYQNENFVQTDTMTNAEIQDMAQQLYDQAADVLSRMAQARYTFELNAVNFIFAIEYARSTIQLELGSVINLEVSDDVWAYPILLEISLNYEDPNDFELTFGNRLRLDNGPMTFADLLGSTVNNNLKLATNDVKWNSFDDNYKDGVSALLTEAFDASKNAIISATNQEIRINQNGLLGRKYIGVVAGSPIYDPEQLWMINNQIVFTDDAFNSVKSAIGKISTSSGSFYGVIGEKIYGKNIVNWNCYDNNEIC